MDEPRSPSRFSVLAWSVVFLATGSLYFGCHRTVVSDQNRPGHVDVTEPPPQMDEPERVQPEDPGVSIFYALGRGNLELGGTSREGDGVFTFQTGFETSLGVGFNSETENAWLVGAGNSSGFNPVSPETAYGLSLGWLPYSSHDNVAHRLYGELFWGAFLGAIGAGWFYEPPNGRHGPQISVRALEIFYLRWNANLGTEGWSLITGLSLPLASFFYAQSR